jgi:hypothetical protein
MSQFYVSSQEPDMDIRRCRESKSGRFPIIITGRTETGEIKAFTGIVMAVDYLRDNTGDKCWRITMNDAG